MLIHGVRHEPAQLAETQAVRQRENPLRLLVDRVSRRDECAKTDNRHLRNEAEPGSQSSPGSQAGRHDQGDAARRHRDPDRKQSFWALPGRETIHPARDAATLKKYLLPFKQTAISAPSNVRKIYYVNPPVSGRVGKEVQDFVFAQTKQQLSATGIVIDSRTLVSYPYHHMEPDKEHFLGAQMDDWADKVFEIVQRDLSAQPLAALKSLRETEAAAALVAENDPPGEGPKAEPLVVDAKLVFKSKPMQLKELMPYRESLVAYVYDVRKVIAGGYSEKQVLVMHPSCIALKPQPLEDYRLGATYKLRLEPVAGTLWDTAKSRDQSGLINLEPYVRVEDKLRHPGNRIR